MDLESILKTDAPNVGGTRHDEVYYALVEDVLTFPNLPNIDVAADFAGLVTISTDITFAAGKGFQKLEVIQETGKVESVIEGEMDGKVFRNNCPLVFKGVESDKLGFSRFVKNKHLIFLIREHNGTYRLIGNTVTPARVEDGTADTGDARNAARRSSVNVYDYQDHPAPIYTGTVTEYGASGSGI